MFLHIVAHEVKNLMIQREFVRSGETVSRHFNLVLLVVLRLHDELLKKPQSVTNSCTDPRWKWFENCLGTLDDTYIKVNVSATDCPRYRTRKGEVATNVLGVYDTNDDFVFVLSGWEGSIADSRILRDEILRHNELKVLKEDFLAPYRGERYHLSEWLGEDQTTGARSETFVDARSNVPNMFNDGVPLSNSHHEDIPTIYSQGVHMSLDKMFGTRAEVIRSAMEFENDQLKAIADWLKEKRATEVELHAGVVKQLQDIPKLRSRDRAKLMQILFRSVEGIDGFLSIPTKLKLEYCNVLLENNV
ncbi:putative nuclease HARBI1 [Cucumis melo var. makuwa]|uniref:Nuclease HARBI1 n=1 Tax=Cucumis melo var. makuwa TaxID=1194695 RepID=A0A5D3BBW3_CUCMM|nr:putative nuclease HARBI1 [Cucumis melo var. makuwa]TYJ96509.1 putative nuclease HARBI1 [Cucumis melo var. makuwa]